MAKGKSDDLVKYITEQVVHFVDTPKELRIKHKVKEPWSSKWFGMIPFSIGLWWNQHAPKKARKAHSSKTPSRHY